MSEAPLYIRAIASIVCLVGFIHLLCMMGRDIDNLTDRKIAEKVCLPMDKWIEKNYKVTDGKYYSIHPPNRFENLVTITNRYDEYVAKEVEKYKQQEEEQWQ